MNVKNHNTGSLGESSGLQHALLPSIEMFKRGFVEAEIFFQPYRAPGGDFYWCKNFHYQSVYVVGDCTGHGIGGAMTSMAVIALLIQYFKSLPPKSVNISLKEIYDSLTEVQKENDFLDAELGMILLDRRTRSICYSGTGINLIHKSEEDCKLYQTRKAKFLLDEQCEYEIRLEKGDQLYLYTDGITDQFDFADLKRLGNIALLKMIKACPNKHC
ncbi:MAG: SpoIIE family protein phosphatase [Ekhidna sp.]|nr:SpoIIE family protein phosphatase [Ekhidna sp.]